MAASSSLPPWGHFLEGFAFTCCVLFSWRQGGGRRGSGPEQMVIVCRDSGLGNLGERRLHGAKHRVCRAEGDNFVSPVRRGCRLGRCVSVDAV
jgi:hypothetical protein